MSKAPLHVVWWLVSRASGVIALVLISLTVLMGLAMAARVIPRGRISRAVLRLHEHVALAGLGAIAVHGLALLGDRWLHPGVAGIAVPFALPYRTTFVGLGIIGGYLAALVGPTFYLRKRLGAGRWRKLHRASALVWVLGVVHTLGAGSDASALWLRAVVFAPLMPLAYLLMMRLMRAADPRGAKADPRGAKADPRVPRRPRAAAARARPAAALSTAPE